MRIDNNEGHVLAITLSRSNLLALLAKLDGFPPDSACTISKVSDRGYLVVTGEEDEVHYLIAAPRGLMDEATEVEMERRR